jgi:hypothetical protein
VQVWAALQSPSPSITITGPPPAPSPPLPPCALEPELPPLALEPLLPPAGVPGSPPLLGSPPTASLPPLLSRPPFASEPAYAPLPLLLLLLLLLLLVEPALLLPPASVLALPPFDRLEALPDWASARSLSSNTTSVLLEQAGAAQAAARNRAMSRAFANGRDGVEILADKEGPPSVARARRPPRVAGAGCLRPCTTGERVSCLRLQTGERCCENSVCSDCRRVQIELVPRGWGLEPAGRATCSFSSALKRDAHLERADRQHQDAPRHTAPAQRLFRGVGQA